MKEIYYGFWAQISGWTMAGRAVLLIGIIFTILYLIFMPLLMKIIAIIVKGFDLLLKGLYCIINWGIEYFMSGKSQTAKAEVLNKISGIMGAFSNILCAKAKKISGIKRISILKYLLCYCILILAIVLPGFLKDSITEQYIPYFSVVSSAYQNIEKNALKTAKDYPPLFKTSAKADVAAMEPQQEADKADEVIYLTLSKSGKNGSNVREKPNTKSKVIVTVSGEIKLSYMERQDNWIRVCLEDGTEGWINKNLLEEIPEE